VSLIPHHTSDPVCPLCEQKLLAVHPELQNIFHAKIKPSFPDAHVSWGFRSEKEQEQSVLDGKSKLEFPDSAHNKTPAMAIDLFQIDHAGRAKWDPGFFSAVNQLLEKAAPSVFWGGKWRDLGDFDHFQIKSGQS